MNLDDLLQKVKDESTQLDSLKVFVRGIQQKIADVLAGSTLTPSEIAQVDQIFAVMNDNAQKITDAMNTTSPPAP